MTGHRLFHGVEAQSSNAQAILDECGVDINELRHQWEHQRDSQLGPQAYECLLHVIATCNTHLFPVAPARLKKELDTILTLQGNLEKVNQAIEDARSTFTHLDHAADSQEALESLERTHERLKTKFERLYASLKVPEAFTELEGIDVEFVHTLVLARDLKINILRRAIGSFNEWDRLDQAVGGRSTALGK